MATHNLSEITCKKSARHAIRALDSFVMCAAAFVAAYRSPCLKLDGFILLSGVAFASLVCWQGSSSWSFLIRVVAAAYFFRCTVLFVMGSDAVRAVVFGDVIAGLGAFGIAYAARHILFKYLPQDMNDGSESCPRQGDRIRTGHNGKDQVGQKAPRASSRRMLRSEAAMQSSVILKSVAVFAVGCSGVVGVAATSNPAAAGGVVVLGVSWLFLAGCIRLVKKADGNNVEVGPEKGAGANHSG